MPITIRDDLFSFGATEEAPSPTRTTEPVVDSQPEAAEIVWREGYPLAEIGGELVYHTDEVVYLAVQRLAGNDPDRAAVRNDVGFNRLDAAYGHALAQKPLRQWSEYDVWAARKMLDKYKNTQLADIWSHMPALAPTAPKKPWQIAQERRAAAAGRPVDEPFRRLSLDREGGDFVAVVEQNYDPALVEKIKGLPQRKYDVNKKRWYVPLHLDAIEPLVEFAVGNGYDIPPEVETAITQIIDVYRQSMDMSQATDVDRDFDLPPGLSLFPFQKAGIAYAERAGNVLIADEMGLGKTVQGLIAVKEANQFPVIVICPASLKRNWERETRKWLPGKRVAVLNGGIHPITDFNGDPMYDVLIVNYNSRILSKWLGMFQELEPEAVILDECHAIKNPKAQQSKLVQDLVATTGARVVALSGTPVVNRPMEFWQIVKVLGHQRTFGGWSNYKARYDNANTKAHHELNNRARTNFMVRRLKKDVLTELPAKLYSDVPLEIANREQYDKAERDIAGYFATKKSQDAKFLADVEMQAEELRLEGDARDAFIAAAKKDHFNASYLIAANNEQLLRWEALKQLAVQGKLGSVMEWIDDFLDAAEGQKLVVFVTHTAIGEAIAQKYGADFIHGGVQPDDRLPMVDRFQNDPNRRVIVGNMIAAGEGLTLTAASNVAFVEFGWNRKQHAQAEDRCHRIGQHDTVNVYHLIAERTIEQEIIALIERKRVISEAIQDGDAESQAEFMADLQRLLDDRLSGKK